MFFWRYVKSKCCLFWFIAVYNWCILFIIKSKKKLENEKINIILYDVKMMSLHKVSKFKYHNWTN